MKLYSLILILAGALTLMGCGGTAPENGSDAEVEVDAEVFIEGSATHYDELEGVKVSIRAVVKSETERVLVGTFTPDEKGFHLYSIGMSKDGVEGIGMPTLMEVAVAAPVVGVGELVADKELKTLKTELGDFPVYPDGAVELRLPVSFGSAEAIPDRLEVNVTYMSCNDEGCKMPAEALALQVPVN